MKTHAKFFEFDNKAKKCYNEHVVSKEERNFMKKNKKAQLPIRKIIGICLMVLFIMGVGVAAGNAQISNVKIILSNGYII